MDTAGLRESADEIERMGMERARSAMTSADIIAIVLDMQSEPELAAMLQQQQQQAPARPHEQGMGVENALMAVGDRLITEAAEPDYGGEQSSLAASERQRGAKSIEGNIASTEQDDIAVSRPQHQKMLLVLNKSDLSPLSQQFQGLSAPADIPAQSDSSQVSSNGTNLAEPSTRLLPQSSDAAASATSSSQPDRLNAPQADTSWQGQSRNQADETAGDMAGAVAISCRTGEGLDRLLARLSHMVADITQCEGADGTIITRYCSLSTYPNQPCRLLAAMFSLLRDARTRCACHNPDIWLQAVHVGAVQHNLDFVMPSESSLQYCHSIAHAQGYIAHEISFTLLTVLLAGSCVAWLCSGA